MDASIWTSTRASRYSTSMLKAILVASIGLPLPSLALDFQFNQQISNGQPLVSSFFGVPGTNATFDYVIAGGGTGGLALATRLAAANYSVAVIEAGGFYETDNGNLTVIPAFSGNSSGLGPTDFQPLVDWGILTVPMVGASNRSLHYARGKTLGGSSARNNLVYHRPTRGSLQKWADEVDDQSWTWDNHIGDYKKAVHFTPPDDARYPNSSNIYDPNAFQPPGNPVHVSYTGTVDTFAPWVRRAMVNSNVSAIAGLNSGCLLGSSYATFTIDPRTGRRSSSESSYLQSALNNRIAPIIYKNTLATEILFNGTTATGILALTAGSYGTPSVNFIISARNEVIVAGGAIHSPQLLMVSGIGNCTELSAFNISCKLDLPGVGQNLWDHFSIGVSHAINIETPGSAINNSTFAEEILGAYLRNAGGPDSIFGTGYIGFEKLPQAYRQLLSNSTLSTLQSTFPADWPELEFLPHTAYTDGTNYGFVNTALVAPLSRGTVSLNSPYAWELPRFDPGFLTAPEDRELAVQAFRRLRSIWQNLVDLGIADAEEATPGSAVNTDDQILQYIEQNLGPVWHASGTCKMGRGSDRMAVVDSHAVVFGTSNLRVVDASAFPFLPPGHPSSTVYAFAEKIADRIISA